MLDIIAAVLLTLATSRLAAPPDASACASIADSGPRLTCYDRTYHVAATETPSPPAPAPEPPPPPKTVDASPAAEPPTVTTQEIVKPIAPADYKVADPADLKLAPRKFLGKPIEVRHTHCYYADVGDYRCLTPGYAVVAVFAPDVEPADQKTKMENDCGAAKAMMTPLCERTLHFVLDDFAEDQLDGNVSRMTLRPHAIVIVPAAPAGKKKR